jgi:hypothetical protein
MRIVVIIILMSFPVLNTAATAPGAAASGGEEVAFWNSLGRSGDVHQLYDQILSWLTFVGGG